MGTCLHTPAAPRPSGADALPCGQHTERAGPESGTRARVCVTLGKPPSLSEPRFLIWEMGEQYHHPRMALLWEQELGNWKDSTGRAV